jgi:hypothetical protein
MVIGLLGIIMDIINIFLNDNQIYLPKWVDFMRTIISLACTFIMTIAILVAGISSSKTLAEDWQESLAEEILSRYWNSNTQAKAKRIMNDLQAIKVSHDSLLYLVSFRFQSTILDNLRYRMNLSSMSSFIITLLFFFNTYIIIILYSGLIEIDQGTSKSNFRIVYLAWNIINPITSTLLSYIIVLCDNINSIIVYIDKVREMKNAFADQEGYVKNKIREFTKQIETPFIHCLTTPD